jgi:hypothetical protein
MCAARWSANMKTNGSNEDDAPLRAVLREWKESTPLPPRFQEQVWRRIERSEAPAVATLSVSSVLMNWIATMLPRPALAAAYMAVLLAIGATAGWTQARQETARVSDELGARYVRSVDPYQAVR